MEPKPGSTAYNSQRQILEQFYNGHSAMLIRYLDIRGIEYENLRNKIGVQAMAFDKDNCLTAPYVPRIHSEYKVTLYFSCLCVFPSS